MKIRSITVFHASAWPLDETALQRAGEFASVAQDACRSAGYDVQTVRLALPPFPAWLPRQEDIPAVAQVLEAAARAQGFAYLSLGPALPDQPWSYEVLPSIIAATENTFVSGAMTSPQQGISLTAVRACADVIHALAAQRSDGFANLYFAALANVPAGAPFLPAAYHDGGAPAFAVALEAADLAVTAFDGAPNLRVARQSLVEQIEAHAQALQAIAEILTNRFEIRFGGLDCSLAPYPEEARSLGAALEHLGVPVVGGHGSLAAAAFLAECIDRAKFRRVGFSGLMLPVLEDARLARRAADGALSVKDLLLFSAVCGTGLDTIPLPGDTSADELYPVLLDLAALATRLRKPLTARLMPMPGKTAGDEITFAFPYFADSRVMALQALPLQGAWLSGETFDLNPRPAA
ncbi:MAG: PFL family protein [Anaerolineales bacterium]